MNDRPHPYNMEARGRTSKEVGLSATLVTFECTRYAFLSAGYVETGGGDRVVTTSLQWLALMDLLEEQVASILETIHAEKQN